MNNEDAASPMEATMHHNKHEQQLPVMCLDASMPDWCVKKLCTSPVQS